MKHTRTLRATDEALGWAGVLLIVSAYLLVSIGFLDATESGYQLLNLLGAAAIAWVSYKKHIMQTLILNLFWGAIAAVTLLGIVSHL